MLGQDLATCYLACICMFSNAHLSVKFQETQKHTRGDYDSSKFFKNFEESFR